MNTLERVRADLAETGLPDFLGCTHVTVSIDDISALLRAVEAADELLQSPGSSLLQIKLGQALTALNKDTRG